MKKSVDYVTDIDFKCAAIFFFILTSALVLIFTHHNNIYFVTSNLSRGYLLMISFR